MKSIKSQYETVRRLREFELLEALPEELVWELSNDVVEETVRKDVTLMRPFSKSERAFFLLRGEVEVERYDESTHHASKASLRTVNTMCGPIKIKSYRNNSNISVLKPGSALGFDPNVVKRGVHKPYLSPHFAKTKSNSLFYIIDLRKLSEIFSTLQKHCLERLLTIYTPRMYLSLDEYTDNQSIQQRNNHPSKPDQSNAANTPISRQQMSTHHGHPRNRSCLETYSNQKYERQRGCERAGSKDQMDQNVSFYIHNLIVKKIRKHHQRERFRSPGQDQVVARGVPVADIVH